MYDRARYDPIYGIESHPRHSEKSRRLQLSRTQHSCLILRLDSVGHKHITAQSAANVRSSPRSTARRNFYHDAIMSLPFSCIPYIHFLGGSMLFSPLTILFALIGKGTGYLKARLDLLTY